MSRVGGSKLQLNPFVKQHRFIHIVVITVRSRVVLMWFFFLLLPLYPVLWSEPSLTKKKKRSPSIKHGTYVVLSSTPGQFSVTILTLRERLLLCWFLFSLPILYPLYHFKLPFLLHPYFKLPKCQCLVTAAGEWWRLPSEWVSEQLFTLRVRVKKVWMFCLLPVTSYWIVLWLLINLLRTQFFIIVGTFVHARSKTSW